MNIEANEMIQYSTMILGSTGIIAFLVSAVVQTIKDLPVIGRMPTSVVAFVVSLVLCPVAVIETSSNPQQSWGDQRTQGAINVVL